MDDFLEIQGYTQGLNFNKLLMRVSISKIILLLVMNILCLSEWGFIFANYDNILWIMKERIHTPDKKNEIDYLDNLKNPDTINDSFIWIDDIMNLNKLNYGWIGESNIVNVTIPSIYVDANVLTTNSVYEWLLDEYVLNLKLDDRKWLYLIWHSSSVNDSKYKFIFLNITRLWVGNKVIINYSNGKSSVYEYKNAFYKKPEKLNELKDDKNKLYLITCYPFNTSITRYVVELDLVEGEKM